MALGLHLRNPPPRTASLQRSRQTPFLSDQKDAVDSCSLVAAFLSKLEFPVAPASDSFPAFVPSGWSTESQEEIFLFDLDFPSSPSLDDDIPLPSTPSTPRFFTRFFADAEPEEEIDIEIPLMTSLFYDDGGSTVVFPRDRPPTGRLHRSKAAVPSQSFPSDVDAFTPWCISRPSTPSPCTPSTSSSSEYDIIPQRITEATKPASVAQELFRLQSRKRRPLNHPQHVTSSPRRLPKPPVPSAMVNPSVKEAPVTPAAQYTQPAKPKFRPLPPTPLSKSTPAMGTTARNIGSSFLSLSSPHGFKPLNFDGLF